MTWKFPFVSRMAFEEAKQVRDERISELRAQVAALETERKRLSDFWSLGTTGRSIYGEIPEPKHDEPEPEPEAEKKPDDHVPTRLEQDIEQFGPNARAIQKANERRNVAIADKDQEEVASIFSEMQAQVEREAKNGAHGR
jgi:hypothetical protein